MKTREDKIKFLKGLLTGERKLEELNREKNRVRQFIHDAENPGMYEEVIHREVGQHYEDEPPITEEQLQEIKKRNKVSVVNIVYVQRPLPQYKGGGNT